jgi:hypothetical protein
MRFADVGDVVIRKQDFAIVCKHERVYARPLLQMLEPHRSRIHIGVHRQVARRLSAGSGLHLNDRNSQWS